jgi:tricorn protease
MGVWMRFVSLGLLIVIASGTAYGQSSVPLLLRDPSVSRTAVAFSYAGNIWIANRDGSDLRRLTTGGHETKPAFAPDGTQIAFIGQYDGPPSVYIVPVAGGEPLRLTYHPADFGAIMLGKVGDTLGWMPDGKHILFSSRRAAFAEGVVQLFSVPNDGGAVTQLPFSRAAQASFSADGSRIAYVTNIRWQPEWKRYRGGQTTSIRIAKMSDSSLEGTVPRNNSNDFNPLWVGDTIYFLSDRNGPVTLFSYDLKSGEVKQIVKNTGFDMKSAAASSDAIVYDQFGSLHLLDLATGSDHVLDIRPVADFPEVRPHFMSLADLARGLPPTRSVAPKISPSGARAVFGLHGDILTVPAEKGDVRNLTRTVGVVERDPAWSPDGKSIAYFSDESGEYELHTRGETGLGAVSKISLGSPSSFYYSPTWSPDSKKVGYTDKRLNYYYVDLKKRTPVRVDTDLYTDPAHGLQMAWSPDSRWIAYTKQVPSHLHAVFIYSVEQAKSYQLTDGTSDALYVAFDKAGAYLYFTSSTDVGPTTGWLDMSSLHHSVTRSVYALVLNKTAATPLPLQSDDERTNEPDRRREDDRVPGNAVAVDLDGIAQRIVSLPIPPRNYVGLLAGKPGVIFLVEGPLVDDPSSTGSAEKVQKFDIHTRKTEQILDGVADFDLSFNGEKMLYVKQKTWFITAVDARTADSSQKGQDGLLNLESTRIFVVPREEWKHMFEQVWRDERDFFYDPGLHGVDLDEIKKQYEPFLDNVSSRDDLDYLFGEMLANLTVGHMSALAPSARHPRAGAVGLLGADYSVQHGRYQISRIYSADTWNPESRSPLIQPGMIAHVGEYLLAVNGRDIRPSADIYSYFEETAGRQVVLKVGPSPDGSGSRDITVVPIDDESGLRHYAWIDNNRHMVDELSRGRVAYIYLPDTHTRGYSSFDRYFFSQVGKDAAIVDERYNVGGEMADYVVDSLRRPLLGYFHMREGRDITVPMESIFGPKVMIINEMAGSGGDALAWMFRSAGIGPLIGTRTWGGLVGGYTSPDDLLDGGVVATPDLAFYNLNGAWDIENHGVPPDIKVEDSAQAERTGHDPQLEKAIEVVMDLLQRNPPPSMPSHPPYPNYQRRDPH